MKKKGSRFAKTQLPNATTNHTFKEGAEWVVAKGRLGRKTVLDPKGKNPPSFYLRKKSDNAQKKQPAKKGKRNSSKSATEVTAGNHPH